MPWHPCCIPVVPHCIAAASWCIPAASLLCPADPKPHPHCTPLYPHCALLHPCCTLLRTHFTHTASPLHPLRPAAPKSYPHSIPVVPSASLLRPSQHAHCSPLCPDASSLHHTALPTALTVCCAASPEALSLPNLLTELNWGPTAPPVPALDVQTLRGPLHPNAPHCSTPACCQGPTASPLCPHCIQLCLCCTPSPTAPRCRTPSACTGGFPHCTSCRLAGSLRPGAFVLHSRTCSALPAPALCPAASPAPPSRGSCRSGAGAALSRCIPAAPKLHGTTVPLPPAASMLPSGCIPTMPPWHPRCAPLHCPQPPCSALLPPGYAAPHAPAPSLLCTAAPHALPRPPHAPRMPAPHQPGGSRAPLHVSNARWGESPHLEAGATLPPELSSHGQWGCFCPRVRGLAGGGLRHGWGLCSDVCSFCALQASASTWRFPVPALMVPSHPISVCLWVWPHVGVQWPALHWHCSAVPPSPPVVLLSV